MKTTKNFARPVIFFTFQLLIFSAKAEVTDSQKNIFPRSILARRIELGVNEVLQGRGNSTGAVLRYAPQFLFTDLLSAGVSLDAANLKLDTKTHFVAFGAMAFGQIQVQRRLAFRASLGAQTWTCANCGTKIVAGPSVFYALNLARASFVKNIWVAYLPVFHQPIAHAIQVGLEFNF